VSILHVCGGPIFAESTNPQKLQSQKICAWRYHYSYSVTADTGNAEYLPLWIKWQKCRAAENTRYTISVCSFL
jgi:hypothetical protein